MEIDSDDGLDPEAGPSSLTWEELPKDLSNWLQSQDGLKIDGSALSTRRELEDAFSLLHCHLEDLPFRELDLSPITDIAVVAAERYIHHVTKPPRPTIRDLVILARHRQIIPRRCSHCRKRLFDDAFPMFTLKDPSIYILRSRELRGCGLPGCKGKVYLNPFNGRQRYTQAQRQVLEDPPISGITRHGHVHSAAPTRNANAKGFRIH